MRFLIAVDLSDLTPAVLDYAKGLALAVSPKCWLVHVAAPDPAFVGYEAGPQVERDQRAATLLEEHREVGALAEELRGEGLDCTGLLVQGQTVDTLLQEAESLEADLIVMGSHGKGWAKRALFGSVSEGVLHKSKLPVLIVPNAVSEEDH
jgi:nucleotide-binding universal stress UspA family protein